MIADALSRVSPQDVELNIEQESPIFTVNTLTNFQEGEEKMALMEETAKDPELCSTQAHIRGMASKKIQCT